MVEIDEVVAKEVLGRMVEAAKSVSNARIAEVQIALLAFINLFDERVGEAGLVPESSDLIFEYLLSKKEA